MHSDWIRESCDCYHDVTTQRAVDARAELAGAAGTSGDVSGAQTAETLTSGEESSGSDSGSIMLASLMFRYRGNLQIKVQLHSIDYVTGVGNSYMQSYRQLSSTSCKQFAT